MVVEHFSENVSKMSRSRYRSEERRTLIKRVDWRGKHKKVHKMTVCSAKIISKIISKILLQ